MTSMSIAFNENSEKPRFIYKANPANPHAFQLFEHMRRKDIYNPVGDYIVLDTSEPRDLSEKKVMNVVSLMNGRGIAVDISEHMTARTLYHVKDKKVSTDDSQIIFRTHDGKGVSKENALLKVKGGIFDD